MTLDEAVDVFGAGFTYTRSFTHPFEYTRLGPLRVMRDAPKKKVDPRVEEIISVGVSPAETVAAIREYRPQKFMLCAVHGPDESEKNLKEAYKGEGFRLLRREPMMIRRTSGASHTDGGFEIRRVETRADAEQIFRAARTRQILERDLVADAPLRLYAAWEATRPVGWVRSIATPHQAAWVSNMHVEADCRRRGIARALMSKMLVEDAARGIEWSVLLASLTGALLYPVLGYEQIGQLLLFAPIKDRWRAEELI
jgi:ribosomal protein S18 acetylase RimI-like enzyme